ncbi:MAG: hypothetical protein AB7F96_21950 [Beijerinckiaceae bacterium]
MLNPTSLTVLFLLLVATGLTWLVRSNRIVLIACLFLAPLPAAAVMAFWAERFPSDPPNADMLRIAVAVPVCYAIVWLSLLAGWLSGKIRDA